MTSRLADFLVRVEAGRSFGAATRPATDDEWGIVKASAMTWEEFQPDENKVVTDTSRIDPRHEIRSGDVLVSRANTTDYVGASVLVRHTRPKLLLSDKSLRLVPRGDVDPAYLHTIMSAPQTRKRISALALAEAHLDGKFLLRSSDPTLSVEDIALGYKQLVVIERAWRNMKTTLDLRPSTTAKKTASARTCSSAGWWERRAHLAPVRRLDLAPPSVRA